MWFPPFPWLHEHAQWSDAFFAATTALWIFEHWQTGNWPRWRSVHSALAAYLAASALSLLFAPPYEAARAWKLLGVAELMVLAYITSDIARSAGRAICLTVALTSLATAAAALIGCFLLFYAGDFTGLLGVYGELTPSRWYARVQAGTYNPNLLASYCIFAAAVVAQGKQNLPKALRRLTQVALGITVLFTFSRGILGFALAAVLRSANTPRRRVLAFACAIACAAIIAALSIWSVTLDPARPLGASVNAGKIPTRREAALSCLRAVASHPLFGSGLDTSPGEARGAPFLAHMTLLNIAATLGLPAVAAFSCLLLMLWRRRSRPADLAIWSGIAGLFLDGLAQDVEGFRHLWVMIGLADARGESALQAQSPSQAGHAGSRRRYLKSKAPDGDGASNESLR